MLTQNNSSTIYVSQEYGDDNYTGTSAKAGEYGAGPFRTLERAMYVILCMRASGLRHNISIKIIGDYCMNNTLKFGFSENTCYLFGGHHNMSNVTLEGYDKNARVIGGKKLKGFKKDVFNGKECISLYIPEVKEGKWKFTDLYVNGKRAESTKYPKNGTLKAVATEMGEKKELFDGSKWFIAKKEDLENIKGIEHSIVSFYHYWIDEHSPVESYDYETGKLTMEYRSRFAITVDYEKNGTSDLHYYLENIAETFSDENEWFLDVKNGMLYYIPEENVKNIEDLEIIAPTVSRIFKVNGEPDNKLKAIRIRNITLLGSKGDYVSRNSTDMKEQEEKFASDAQSVHAAHGAVLFENAECCCLENVNLLCMGVHAVEISYGSENIRVENCRIENAGAGGIKVYGGDANASGEKRTSGCIIRKNLIKNCGRRYAAGCGILINHASNNEISDNEICYLDYSGISAGFVWGYYPSNTYANLIRNNHIHHIGTGRLSDMGGIYLLGYQEGTLVQGNLIHDITSAHYGGWGLYTDEGSSYITFEDNVIYNCKDNCYHQNYGSYNVLRNNVFAFSGNELVRVSRNESHLGLLFENNVFITDKPSIYYTEHLAPLMVIEANNNTYYSTKGEVTMYKGKYSLEEWQKAFGKDEGSVVKKPDFILIDEEKREIKIL
ncbi:MAG: right-handed parallel beta-helix repeat-containing protein [Ruminococcaceae bacterium]|nr:right-handed parallel beta-helix repeat-containing protein [Oscillospiraceae bacterium]